MHPSPHPFTANTIARYCLLTLALVPFALFTPACKVGPNFKNPDVSLQANWRQHQPSGKSTAASSPEVAWWKTFNDPTLDKLIAKAYADNLSLQAAGTRILQARAALNQSIGKLFPQDQALAGGVDYFHIKNPSGTIDGLPLREFLPGLGSDFASANYLFSASWEIDFWGKYRRGIESSQASFYSSIAAYDDSLVTLLADVANAYINIRTLEQRLAVNRENVASQEETLNIAEVRFEAGETSDLDVEQAKTNLAETQSAVPGLKSSLRQAKNGLAILLGLTPDEIDPYLGDSRGIPRPPSTLATGIPHDLLRRRPDVREAGLNAAAQSANIGVAKANLYPSFSLKGAFGFSSSDIGNSSLDNVFNWNNRIARANASFLFPIFNYGRLVNEVRIQDAAFQGAVLDYQNTVLTAQQEVENGLTSFRFGKETATLLSNATESSNKSTELAVVQYKAGAASYTTVLTAQQAALRIDDNLANAQGNTALAAVAVYRALGGGWQIREGQPVLSESVRKQMAERTNWGDLLEPENEIPKEKPKKNRNDEESAQS
ncbi:MAG: efflux transporter outer membrane subunit [Verrucomicrobiota bacterium]